jgi:membrane fusion protein (multidrug efflux system)
LRIGMSLTTEVDLHDQNGLTLAQAARTQPRFSTDVYKDQLADANAQIERIIHDNMGGR